MITSIEEHQDVLLEMLTCVHEIAERIDLDYFLYYGTALGAVRDHALIPWDWDADIIIPWSGQQAFRDALVRGLPPEFVYVDRESTPGYDHYFPRVALRGVDHNLVHVDVFLFVASPVTRVGRHLVVRLARLLSIIHLLKNTTPALRYAHDPGKRRTAVLLKLALRLLPARLVDSTFRWVGERRSLESVETWFNIGGHYGMREHLPKAWFATSREGTVRGRVFRLPGEYHAYLRHMYGAGYVSPVDPERQETELAFFNDVVLPRIAAQLPDE